MLAVRRRVRVLRGRLALRRVLELVDAHGDTDLGVLHHRLLASRRPFYMEIWTREGRSERETREKLFQTVDNSCSILKIDKRKRCAFLSRM